PLDRLRIPSHASSFDRFAVPRAPVAGTSPRVLSDDPLTVASYPRHGELSTPVRRLECRRWEIDSTHERDITTIPRGRCSPVRAPRRRREAGVVVLPARAQTRALFLSGGDDPGLYEGSGRLPGQFGRPGRGRL